MAPPTITPLQVLGVGADSIHLSKRPLPTAPDGRYHWQNKAQPGQSAQGHSEVTNLVGSMEGIKSKGGIVPDPRTMAAFIQQAHHPEAVDDRLGAFSAGLDLLYKLPADSDASKKLGDTAVGTFYNDLPHPSVSFLGPERSFRSSDGAGNNLHIPDLGRAGMPYARNVQGKWAYAQTALPDPGLVFDTLFKARGERRMHAGGNSSLTFAFATIVIHSLFRTDHRDWNINTTSSYLDLSPLYGVDQAAQDQVRNKEAGRGLLYPDTFSEDRLSFLPPAASAILVLFSRNHNVSSSSPKREVADHRRKYIANMLLKINERKCWSDPAPTDEAKRAKQDEDIFQTARLVNCGHFMGMIMSDYVAGFLGQCDGGAWKMNAFDPITLDGAEVRRGEGNHCSVEFNVLYRWHPTLSKEDGQWTKDVFDRAFKGKPAEELTLEDFERAAGETFASVNPDPKQRTFGGMKRDADGRFPDSALAKILLDATDSPAGAYGARNTPPCLRVIEIMGILQARQWGVCTMNEFRSFMGLKPFVEWGEWSSDRGGGGGGEAACEDTMPITKGSRFAAGYTMTRAVLADAISLVRGDRFYTTDFSPAHLTAWGYQDCLRDPNNGGFGGELTKLLMRHLPRHYPYNSVYGCFPFYTPTKMLESLTRMGIADQYTFDRPTPARVPVVLHDFTAINYVFSDPARFKNVYDMKDIGNGYGFLLGFDEPKKHDPDLALALHGLFPTQGSMSDYRVWYREKIGNLVEDRSFALDGARGRFVDIVRNVVNVAAIHWATDKLCGIALKTKENPSGMYTEQEMYDMFETMFTLTFLSIGDNEHMFSRRWAAFQCGGIIQALIGKSILEVAPHTATNPVVGFISSVSKFIWSPANKPCYPFLSKLTETGRPVNELVAMVLSLAVGSSVNYANAAVNVIDFYLDDARAAERADIISLVQRQDIAAQERLYGYVREGMRLNPQFPGLYRDAAVDASIPQGDGKPNVEVKAGDRIWGSFRNAHLQPTEFPNPTSVDPTRPRSAYHTGGAGFHACRGQVFAEQTIAEILKVVFKLKNVRRAPGDMGRLAGFKTVFNETETKVYLTPYGTTSAWPGSMWLQWDD
ncbi:Heme peroxidase [Mycena kentingensis (nom. inval.)]|nr:Heme peroxidase [Mycena kentingensis (nom. inval.)]